jgi:transposase
VSIVSTIFLGGHMNTELLSAPLARTHRRHSPEFKAQAIAACLQPGVSIAAVALANQLNANLLRKWVKGYREQQAPDRSTTRPIDQRRESAHSPSPSLVPVTVQAIDGMPAGDIQIEIRWQQTHFQITWPASQSSACAQWLRDVLR